MSGYEEDLRKLKRATARSASGSAKGYACCVCSATPAPDTRFGPRCEKHRPADPRIGQAARHPRMGTSAINNGDADEFEAAEREARYADGREDDEQQRCQDAQDAADDEWEPDPMDAGFIRGRK